MAKRAAPPAKVRGPAKRQWTAAAANLRERRKAKGWTLAQLADEAGISEGMVSQLENGKSGGSGDSWERLAKALGCTVGALLGTETAPNGDFLWVSDDERPRVEAFIAGLRERRR